VTDPGHPIRNPFPSNSAKKVTKEKKFIAAPQEMLSQPSL
jgi:hypothetical protein